MIPRLHLDGPLQEGVVVPLTEAQAHYLRAVLRREDGASVLVFNARDGEYEAALSATGKRGAGVTLGRRVRSPSAEPDVWLIFAGVKRAAIETIVQKGAELGVARFCPVLTERTHRERINPERLRAIAVEATEQCLRLSVPEIAAARPLAALLDDWPAARRLYFCDEAGDDADALWGGRVGRARPMRAALQAQSPAAAAVLIGPEGGFSAAERARLRALAFVEPVTLGPRILRADTAAIAALTLWQAHAGDLNQM